MQMMSIPIQIRIGINLLKRNFLGEGLNLMSSVGVIVAIIPFFTKNILLHCGQVTFKVPVLDGIFSLRLHLGQVMMLDFSIIY